MKTREKYQKTQADRVRTCYKEGKAQALFVINFLFSILFF
jgi:hypothetical protein